MILIKLQILRRMLRGVKIWCQALSNVLNTLTPLVDLEHFLLFLRQPIADGDRRGCDTWYRFSPADSQRDSGLRDTKSW